MSNTATATIRDFSDELTTTSWNVADGTTSTGILDIYLGAIYTDSIVLGIPFRSSVLIQNPTGIAGTADPSAQRELKWAVSYRDVSEFLDPGTDSVPNPGYLKNFTFELGTANPALLAQGTDRLAVGSDEFNTIATANTFAISPYGGDIEVTQVRLVGRAI